MTSEKAKAGDRMPLTLDQDIKQDDTVVVAKGTPVEALITIARSEGRLGCSG